MGASLALLAAVAACALWVRRLPPGRPTGERAKQAPLASGPITAVRRTAGGIIALGTDHVVRIRVVNDRTFRISVAEREDDLPRDGGTFIAPGASATPPAAWRVAESDADVVVRTANSALRLRRADGLLLLEGKNGRTRHGPARWSRDREGWRLFADAPEAERVYGFGNRSRHKQESLVKVEGISGVGNGVSQPPFVWSTAGYGVLAGHERGGAGWRRAAEGGVSRHAWSLPREVPALDLYLFTGDTPYQLLNAYAALTGPPLVPPRWTFGFLQSRWGYEDAADVRDKWHRFRRKRIPVDAFIYDYDWFVNDWEWNPTTFPEPAADVAAARALGIKTVLIRKPRVNGANLALAERNHWIAVRRGRGSDLDFSRPDVRAWWWGKHIPLVRDGAAGWWNDEAEQYYLEFFYMTLAQHDGLAQARPGARNWSLNRAFTPGIQRLGGVAWTGDVPSSWEALRKTQQTLLNYGLSGMPHAGSDIGGFHGKPTPELFVRWVQAGAFHPIMRAHGDVNQDRWPWSYGPGAEDAVTKAIRLRYRLLPYYYSLAHEAYRTGAPLMRPLFFDFPGDPRTRDLDDQWLAGPALLVAPQQAPGGERSVYLPRGTWHEWQGAGGAGGRTHTGPATLRVRSALDEIPVYARGGSIVPLAPAVQQSAGREPADLLTVEVFAGASGRFALHEDDGETYDYRRGRMASTGLHWDDPSRRFTVEPAAGRYPGMPAARRYEVRVRGVAARPARVLRNGVPLPRADWSYRTDARSVEISLGPEPRNARLTLQLR